MSARRKRVYLDLTHLGRHVTGIERIAIELFEKVEFAEADVRAVRSSNLVVLILKQQLLLPLLALLNPRAEFVFPGFPPSPLMLLARDRVTLYVHDLFLINRRQDLGLKAKLYMAWPFRLAVTRLKRFLVNSAKTRSELEPFVADDAEIALYRPAVGNVFGVAAGERRARADATRPLRLLALGTVEPRKNYAYAAAIRHALARRIDGDVELHVVGRPGWGGEAERLAGEAGVTMHGYLSLADARRVIESADVYLCTSHDEGLGLPLLEVQFAGLPVVAPDSVVFREVLADSGTFIPQGDAEAAAQIIAALVGRAGWRSGATDASLANLERWNRAAETDAQRARRMFAVTADDMARTSTPAATHG
jgi:glycosyltransferase involved in cell wall biosynthesis